MGECNLSLFDLESFAEKSQRRNSKTITPRNSFWMRLDFGDELFRGVSSSGGQHQVPLVKKHLVLPIVS